MINYYFKYIELLDTVFLAFKKKPLGMYFYAPQLDKNSHYSSQLSFMFSTTLQLQCYALLNSTGKQVWYVPLYRHMTAADTNFYFTVMAGHLT